MNNPEVRDMRVLRSVDEFRNLVLLCLLTACWVTPVARAAPTPEAEQPTQQTLSVAELLDVLWDLRRVGRPTSALDESGLAIIFTSAIFVGLAIGSCSCIGSLALPGRTHGWGSTLAGVAMTFGVLGSSSLIDEAAFSWDQSLHGSWGFVLPLAAGFYLIARPTDPMRRADSPVAAAAARRGTR